MVISPETSAKNIAKLSDPNRGRLVAVSLSDDGNFFRLFAGMGGRSLPSKNRYYQQLPDLNGNGNYIRTAIHNPLLRSSDDQAVIDEEIAKLYIAQRAWNYWHVASNGEQTDGIGVALAAGASFSSAQEVYTNEGPQNDYTSRITAAVCHFDKMAYLGKIVREPSNQAESCYETYMPGFDDSLSLNPGEGYLIVTYDGKGGTEPSYDKPWGILLPGRLEDNMDLIWNNWDPNTRANLVGKEIKRGSGRFTYSFRSIHPGRA